MEILFALLPQIIKMFLLMGVGYFIFKKSFFTEETTKQLSWFLVNIVIPCVLFLSFIRPFDIEEFQLFGLTFVMSLVAIAIGILYANICFKKEQTLEKFGVIFSNASFIGIPIIRSLFGSEALFYLSAYIAAFVFMVFTYGVFLISQKKEEVQMMKIIKNTNILAILLGLVVYLLSIPFPEVFTDTLGSLGAMNTPMSMMLLGAYLAKDSLYKLATNIKCYWVGLGRLILVPILTIISLQYFPGDSMLKMIVVVVNSVPSAVMLALFAQLYDKDTALGAQYVSFTTLARLVTLPLIVVIAQVILL